MYDELGEPHVRQLLDPTQTGPLLRQRLSFLHRDDSTLLGIGVMDLDTVEAVQGDYGPIEQRRIRDDQNTAIVLHVVP
jgi:hypothetical protein